MGNKQKPKEKEAYSTPHILEKHVDGHVTIGINGEASKGRRRGMVVGVGACAWGTGGCKKRKGHVQGLSSLL